MFLVSFLVSSICAARTAVGALPPAIQPKQPLLQTAETSLGSETQVIAPQMIGYLVPRNSAPRRISGESRSGDILPEKLSIIDKSSYLKSTLLNDPVALAKHNLLPVKVTPLLAFVNVFPAKNPDNRFLFPEYYVNSGYQVQCPEAARFSFQPCRSAR